jgi:hypothetical protein
MAGAPGGGWRSCGKSESWTRRSPPGALALADLAQVEQGFLDGAPAAQAAVFHHAPVAVEFAVFAAGCGAQEHGPNCRQKMWQRKGAGLHRSAFLPPPPQFFRDFCWRPAKKS